MIGQKKTGPGFDKGLCLFWTLFLWQLYPLDLEKKNEDLI